MRAGANVKQWDAELPRPRVVVRYRGFAARAEGCGCSGGGAACLYHYVLYKRVNFGKITNHRDNFTLYLEVLASYQSTVATSR